MDAGTPSILVAHGGEIAVWLAGLFGVLVVTILGGLHVLAKFLAGLIIDKFAAMEETMERHTAAIYRRLNAHGERIARVEARLDLHLNYDEDDAK